MALVDPVKIYAAHSNLNAQMICRLLEAAGIEAFAGEDFSPAGLWVGGTIPGIFDAGVFVERADVERAMEVIREQERLEAQGSNEPSEGVDATCVECGQTSTFPAAKAGTVQECPHCGSFLDVGEGDLPEGWVEGDTDDGAGSEDGPRE